jgi:glutathione S-transferase
MMPNADLVAWTGHRNAPIACLDDEPPLTGWHEILLLAERLGRGPSLLPESASDRALCLGLCLELAGHDGFGWNRRHQIMGAHLDNGAVDPALAEMARAYGVNAASIARAPARLVAIMAGLADRLRSQHEAGSRYLVGTALSAADVYWACFSMMVSPLAQAVNPMPEWLRPLYAACDPAVQAALEPVLIEHRDMIYHRHIGLPLDY